MVPLWQKKSVWQVTTIIQPALCHLVTSHFQEIACNWTPKDQIRWPIFLMLLCMIVLTEKTSKFPQPIIFWILVFSCHKMTLITKITWMPLWSWGATVLESCIPGLRSSSAFHGSACRGTWWLTAFGHLSTCPMKVPWSHNLKEPLEQFFHFFSTSTHWLLHN